MALRDCKDSLARPVYLATRVRREQLDSRDHAEIQDPPVILDRKAIQDSKVSRVRKVLLACRD